ncbi:UPF0061 protein ECA1842 [Tupaia chinensis]|uniref:Selenoprotein O n=1 Tax=Tupaia chinensis TaxID=246437 RepID=L9LE77_TUPCH|nr:UPF0061 protein ECA1842 [Tupaia chinensis]
MTLGPKAASSRECRGLQADADILPWLPKVTGLSKDDSRLSLLRPVEPFLLLVPFQPHPGVLSLPSNFWTTKVQCTLASALSSPDALGDRPFRELADPVISDGSEHLCSKTPGKIRPPDKGNSSNSDRGYCEIEAKVARSLDFWTLSSENLIGILSLRSGYEVLEDILDLDLTVSETDGFIQLVSGEKIVSGSVPLTHRYGGHQFGIWADQLGDGRAHLIGIHVNSLVVSDDEVWRDQFYNGNVAKERGVCNTDNFSLLSVTIDYGPFGFMEAYDPDFVPNTSDDERRYKIGNQANIGMFNLNKLLEALNPLLDPRQKQLFIFCSVSFSTRSESSLRLSEQATPRLLLHGLKISELVVHLNLRKIN